MSSSAEAKWTFAQKFYVGFSTSASELTSRLDALKVGTDATPSTMQVQVITADLSRLTKSLGDATGSLPSYDQRQCELQLNALEKRVEELRVTSASAPKFSFKRKTTKPKPSAEHASELAVVLPPTMPQPVLVESARTLSERYLTVVDFRSQSTSADVSIADLDNCIVNLLIGDKDRSTITALHVQRISRSVILLPQISGSIILHDLSECVIVVGCHQFRMHNSRAVDVYLENRSDPIIENCSDIRFAAYPSSLAPQDTLQSAKRYVVKDFSHILSTPSPNWILLPEEKWERSWPTSALQDQALRQEIERMLSTHSRSLENGLH